MTPTEAKSFGLIDEVVEKRVWDTRFSLYIQLKLDNSKH